MELGERRINFTMISFRRALRATEFKFPNPLSNSKPTSLTNPGQECSNWTQPIPITGCSQGPFQFPFKLLLAQTKKRSPKINYSLTEQGAWKGMSFLIGFFSRFFRFNLKREKSCIEFFDDVRYNGFLVGEGVDPLFGLFRDLIKYEFPFSRWSD